MRTYFHTSFGPSIDISQDGSRILVNKPTFSLADPSPIVLVTGWAEELKRLVPTD